MSVSFRAGRYLVALLWSWLLPAFIGAVVGFLFATWQVLEVLKASDELLFDALDASITRVAESCAIPPEPPDTLSPPAGRFDPKLIWPEAGPAGRGEPLLLWPGRL